MANPRPTAWIDGSPAVQGEYWIVLHNSHGPHVLAVSISPAVINPGGRLLLKSLAGMAYDYAANRERISHYMPMQAPTLPRGGRRG